MGRPALPVTLERLHARCAPDGDCLLWQGAASGRRVLYGRVRARGKFVLAHRLVFELAHGPIPDGLEVDHTCNRGLCLQPAHLRAVTRHDNAARVHAEGRGRNGSERVNECPNGHGPHDVTRTRGDGRTFRACRTCERDAQTRYRARRTGA